MKLFVAAAGTLLIASPALAQQYQQQADPSAQIVARYCPYGGRPV